MGLFYFSSTQEKMLTPWLPKVQSVVMGKRSAAKECLGNLEKGVYVQLRQ